MRRRSERLLTLRHVLTLLLCYVCSLYSRLNASLSHTPGKMETWTGDAKKRLSFFFSFFFSLDVLDYSTKQLVSDDGVVISFLMRLS